MSIEKWMEEDMKQWELHKISITPDGLAEVSYISQVNHAAAMFTGREAYESHRHYPALLASIVELAEADERTLSFMTERLLREAVAREQLRSKNRKRITPTS